MHAILRAAEKAVLTVMLTIIMILLVFAFAAALPFLGALKALMAVGNLVIDGIKSDARPEA